MRHLAAFLLSCLVLAPACGPAAAGGSFYDPPLAGADTTAIHDNVAGEIAAVGAITPAGADLVLLEDAGSGNVKGQATLQAIFDALAAGSGNTITTDQTYAGCQALTPVEGDLCYPTDSSYTLLARSAGTWSYLHRGRPAVPPPSAGWTDFDGGTGSHTTTAKGGTRVQAHTATAGAITQGEYRAIAADPSAATVYVIYGIDGGSVDSPTATGAFYRNGDIATAEGDVLYLGVAQQAEWWWHSNSITAFGGYYEAPAAFATQGTIWWGWEYGTTNRIPYYSFDRVTWNRAFAADTVALNADIGGNPDTIWWGSSGDATFGAQSVLWDFQTGVGTLPTTLP